MKYCASSVLVMGTITSYRFLLLTQEGKVDYAKLAGERDLINIILLM